MGGEGGSNITCVFRVGGTLRAEEGEEDEMTVLTHTGSISSEHWRPSSKESVYI